MMWVVVFCSFLGAFCLLVGIMAGMAWEGRLADRDEDEDQAGEHDWDPDCRKRGCPVHGNMPGPAVDPFAGIREAGRNAWAVQQECAELYGIGQSAPWGTFTLPDYVAGSAAWLARQHEDEAMAVASDMSDEEFLASLPARVDRFIAEVVHGGQQ